MNFIRSRYQYWLAALAVAFFYCRPLFSGRLLFFAGGDAAHSIYSAMTYFHEWASRGVCPLWNVLSACGSPFGASSISIVNFYYLAAKFLEAGAAYNTVILASVWLNGIFLFEFLLRKGRSPFAAWAGGLLWMIGTAASIDSGFFCLSLSFLLAEIYSARRGRLFYILFVGSLALYAFNAHPQYFLYGSLFLWSYLVSKGRKGSRDLGVLLVSTSVPFLIAFGLAGVHWVRLLEWTLLSNRSSWTLVQAWLPTHYPLVIFPKLYYLAGRPDLDFIVPRIFQWVFSHSPSLKSLEKVIEPPYMGLWPLLGVLVGIDQLKRRQRDSSGFFLISAALVTAYLLLHPLLYLTVIRHLPVLSGMTNIARLFDIYQFSLAVLAAQAVDFMLHRGRPPLDFIRKTAKRLTVALAIFIIFLGLVRGFVGQHEAWFRQKIEANLRVLNTRTIFIENIAEFQNRRADEFLFFVRQCASITNPHLLFPIGLLGALVVMIYAYQAKRISKRSFQCLTALFILADLGSGLGFELSSSDPSELQKNSAIVQLLRQDRELYRVMIVEDKTKSFSQFFLVPQSNMIYDLATPDGYEPLYIKRYVDFYTWLTRREDYPVGFVMHPMHTFDEALADFINVKYFVTSAKNDRLERNFAYQKIFNDEEYRVYRNRHAMPRAFLVHTPRFVRDFKEAGETLRSSPERLRKEVILIGNASAAPEISSHQDDSDEVRVEIYEPNRAEIDVKAGSAGYLVISDTYYPGWRAWVDGKPQKILLADYTFRAVQVPEGKHTVSLRYRPQSLSLGLAVSLGALLVLLIVSKINP